MIMYSLFDLIVVFLCVLIPSLLWILYLWKQKEALRIELKNLSKEVLKPANHPIHRSRRPVINPIPVHRRK